MSMPKVLHPRDDIDRLNVSRNASIEDSGDGLIQKFEDYKENRSGRLITATRNNADNMRTNRNNQKKKWEENHLCKHFKRLKSDIHIYQPLRSGRI